LGAAMSQPVIVVDERDNVATALRELEAGESIRVGTTGQAASITVLRAIPFGHKIALIDIEAGQPVLKYGEVIGLATARIRAGEHTHVHNVEGPQEREDGG
jgi:altronate dehydratase small subunit